MKLPDLNLLPVLDALLRERNLTRAGHSIGMTQPAVSKSLRRLRAFFGDELLLRVGHDYELTPLATELAGPVAEALRQIELAIESRPDFDPAHASQTFTVAASESAAYVLLRRLIERMSQEAPRVALQIRSLNAMATVEQIRAGNLDLGIWRGDLDPGMETERLYEDRMVCAVWRGVQGLPDVMTLEQYEGLRHLTYDYFRPDMANLIKPGFDAFHRFDHTTVSVEGTFLKLFMLRGTSAVAMAPQKLVRLVGETAELRMIQPPFEVPSFHESMYWHPRMNTDPAHVWLRETLRSVSTEV